MTLLIVYYEGNNLKFEYVASGLSFTKCTSKHAFEQQNIDNYIKTIGSLNGRHNHMFGVLYNAFQEKSIGQGIFEYYRPHLGEVYADSGGLQMITRGMTITPDLKDAIYQHQATYAEHAMCFDVIPLQLIGKSKSSRLDLSNRMFDYNMVEACAQETGRNLRDQIDMFDLMGSKAKPMLIVQGNDYDTFMRWVEGVTSVLSPYHISRIGSIALSDASMGLGTLEDIKRAFYVTQMPIDIENKHIHLLGVGSLSRLLPYIVMKDIDGLKGARVSYDSTSHTSGGVMGRYFLNGKTIQVTKEPHINYEVIYNDLQTLFPHLEYNADMLYRTLGQTTKTKEFILKYGTLDPHFQLYPAFIAGTINNFMKCINEAVEDKNVLLGSVNGVMSNVYNSLYEVKTSDDFQHWLTMYGRFVPSNSVSTNKITSLSEWEV